MLIIALRMCLHSKYWKLSYNYVTERHPRSDLAPLFTPVKIILKSPVKTAIQLPDLVKG